MKKVVIGREAYDKIMYYVNKTSFEISGFGNVQVIDGVATVTDIILLKQENHSTETEIDGDAIAKAVYDHYASGVEGNLNFWWHSHVDMPVYWSGTDRETMTELTKNGWWIHGVFNKKNEYRLCYTNNDPFPVEFDNLELEIDEFLVTNEKIIDVQVKVLELEAEILATRKTVKEIIAEECDPLFDELVTVKAYAYNYGFYNYNKGGNFTGKHQTPLKEVAGKTSSTEKSQLSSTVQNIGKVLDMKPTDTAIFGKYKNLTDYYLNADFLHIDGALELAKMGFTEKEAMFLEVFCYVYDAEDVKSYELVWGRLRDEIDKYPEEVAAMGTTA